MSKYQTTTWMAGLVFLCIVFSYSASLRAESPHVDKQLRDHTKQILNSKQRHDAIVISSSNKAAKITVKLPAKKKPLEIKPYWPARKNIDCIKQKCIALTFDDGPSIYTPELLDILKSKGAKATFFVVGSRVAGQEPILQRAINEGHELGNHSFSHADFRTKSQQEVDAEIINTQNEIFRATGYMPHVLRPPYGALPPTPQGQLQNFPIVLWNTDPSDWHIHSPVHVSQQVVGSSTPGSIVLMHDLYPSTINAIPAMIDSLSAQGYTFVTVTELFGWQQNQPLPNSQVLKNR